MRRLENHVIGIDQGEETLFSDFEHDGPMWTGEGPRAKRVRVSFSEAYSAVPSVTVVLSMCDISNMATARLDVRAEQVTPEGFVIVFRTWGDTKIARARVNWTAIGEVPHHENWDIY